MVTRLRISVVLLAAALVAGACAGGATSAPTAPTAVPTATLSPTPAPTRTAAPITGRPGAFAATTGPMSIHRWGHTATLLPSGKVLIAGGRGASGPVASAELYDPSTDTFTPTGSMASVRVGHTATLLTNGKVLITGGEVDQNMDVENLASAELYDPAAGTFSPTGSMSSPRSEHTATLLASGKVLITGGAGDPDDGALASAELYDPATGSFGPTGSMTLVRSGYTATLLQSGQVLIAGGDNAGAVAWAELYTP